MHCYPRMTAVTKRFNEFPASKFPANIYNKSLKYWSLEKQFNFDSLEPLEILGKQNELSYEGTVFDFDLFPRTSY